jgi:hypothetical protein
MAVLLLQLFVLVGTLKTQSDAITGPLQCLVESRTIKYMITFYSW